MDITDTLTPKSDQLNADDLIAGPITVTVERVNKVTGDQPAHLYLAGFPNRPYKPGKSMRRVIAAIWGPKMEAYVGRSMTLYRDPEITFGSDKVGGIRISHMTHLDKPFTMALTVKRGQRRPFQVQPLTTPAPSGGVDPQAIEAATTLDELKSLWESSPTPEQRARIQQRKQEIEEQQTPEPDPAA